MDATLRAHAEDLRQTTERLARMGLVGDRACLSREQRRVIFALQGRALDPTPQPEANKRPIGFPSPNAR